MTVVVWWGPAGIGQDSQNREGRREKGIVVREEKGGSEGRAGRSGRGQWFHRGGEKFDGKWRCSMMVVTNGGGEKRTMGFVSRGELWWWEELCIREDGGVR